MSQDYWQVQNNPKVPKGPIELDEAIISYFPPDAVVKGEGCGGSNWNETARVDVEIQGLQKKSYFLKQRQGPDAEPMFHGEFVSMELINKILPEFSPRPVACGKLRNSDGHFILFTFHRLSQRNPSVPRSSDSVNPLGAGLPSIPQFPIAVAALHARSIERRAQLTHRGPGCCYNKEQLNTLSIDANPTSQFGFHIPTYNGTLKQKNTWTDTWEKFYADEMRHMLKLEEEARGPSEELQQLSGPFLDKVIPRLLRPLETGGRSITPVLLHGDLWLGNVSTQTGYIKPLMFDASAFWGHNEYELATLRLVHGEEDIKWAKECLDSYQKEFPKSEPTEDWEDRNALYSTRVIIHDSALYPDQPLFRRLLIEEMRKLVEKFSGDHIIERQHIAQSTQAIT